MKRGVGWKSIGIIGIVCTLLSAQSYDQCYQIDKQYLKIISGSQQNSFAGDGIMINIDALKERRDEAHRASKNIYFKFDTSHVVYHSDINNQIKCSKEKNGTIFYCLGDFSNYIDNNVTIEKRENDVYFKINHIRIFVSEDDLTVYDIEGKNRFFIKGKPVSCFRSLDAIVEVHNYEKDPRKAILIASLSKLKDIIIYDLDYNDEVAIAVGEDNSVKTRKLYAHDEYHKPLTLYSFDKGKSWQRTYGANDTIPYNSVKLIKGKKAVACGTMEGSGGEIALTEDGGKNWKRVYSGGFLYSVTVHNNTLFAAGYGILRSQDGIHWKRIYKSDNLGFSAIASIANKRLIAVGDNRILLSNKSGTKWHKVNLSNDISADMAREIYQKDGKVYVVVGGPNFSILASSDQGKSWRTLDSKYTRALKKVYFYEKY